MATELYEIPIGKGKHSCCRPKLMEETDVTDTALAVWKQLFWAICSGQSFISAPSKGG